MTGRPDDAKAADPEAERPEPPEAAHAGEDEVWQPDAGPKGGAVEALEKEVARLTMELAETKDRWLRARADYDNLTKRQARERDEMAARSVARVIEPLLGPVEALEKAAIDLETFDDGRGAGVRMVLDQLKAALAREGLEEVPGVGHPFDHHHHEAVAREASDRPEGEVLAVVRPGYRLHGRLLRAALVKVAAPRSADD